MIKKLWKMVNSVNTISECRIAEKEIRATTELSADDFDELMMALSAQERDIYSN